MPMAATSSPETGRRHPQRARVDDRGPRGAARLGLLRDAVAAGAGRRVGRVDRAVAPHRAVLAVADGAVVRRAGRGGLAVVPSTCRRAELRHRRRRVPAARTASRDAGSGWSRSWRSCRWPRRSSRPGSTDRPSSRLACRPSLVFSSPRWPSPPRPCSPASKQVTLTVPTMDCATCPVTIKVALMKVPGVSKAVVSYKHRTALVTFDDAEDRHRRAHARDRRRGLPVVRGRREVASRAGPRPRHATAARMRCASDAMPGADRSSAPTTAASGNARRSRDCERLYSGS